MAYNTTTAAAKPAATRGTAEQAAGAGRDQALLAGNWHNEIVGKQNQRMLAGGVDPSAAGIWDAAYQQIMGASNQDASNQANRWREWWSNSTVPGQVSAYTQEQALADYLGSLGQTGEQKLADLNAEYALAQSRRGGGGGGGGGRRGGGGGGGGVAAGSSGYVIDPASAAAWARALAPPVRPVSRAAVFTPSERARARATSVVRTGQARAV